MSAILALALLAAQRPKTPAFTKYTNVRYGYSIEIPADLKLGRAGENGDGRTFLSKDGRTELLVYGSYFLLDDEGNSDESLAGGFRRWVAQARKKGPEPKLAVLRPGFFSVSWREGRRIAYIRTIRLAEGFATVELRYPFDRKASMDASVTRTVLSLKALKR